MNKAILIGRLTRDPETRYSQGEKSTAVTKYGLAVNRKFVRDGEADCDFINCVAFGKSAEFAEKYFKKGMKIAVVGRIQTGSYMNKENQKIYTTEIMIEEQEFCESKGSSDGNTSSRPTPNKAAGDGFVNVEDGIEEDLPFN